MTTPTTPTHRPSRWPLLAGIIAIIIAIVVVFNTSDGVNWPLHWSTNDSSESSEPSSPETPTTAPEVSDPNAVVDPVVSEGDLATCPTLWSPKTLVECIDKVAPWMWAKIDALKHRSKVDSAMMRDAAARFPDKDIRVLFVYHDGGPTMSEAEIRAKGAAEAKITDPSVIANMPIVNVDKAWPGWDVWNTQDLELKQMDPFVDSRPDQVRVSLVPFLKADGEIDFTMAGSGFFVTCLNLHWLELHAVKSEESTPPNTSTTPGTSTTSTTTTTPSTSTTTTTPSTSTTTTTPSTTTSTTTTTTSTTTSTTPTTAKPTTTNPSQPPGETSHPSPTNNETVAPTESNPAGTTPAPLPTSPREEPAPSPETPAPTSGTTVGEAPPVP